MAAQVLEIGAVESMRLDSPRDKIVLTVVVLESHNHPLRPSDDGRVAVTQEPSASAKRQRVQPEASPALIPPSAENGFILSFSLATNPTPEEEAVATQVLILDHRANHQLSPPRREWNEVSTLLYNAVVMLQGHDPTQGRVIFEEAERVYFHHNQTRNRIRYLTGALIGILVAGILGAAATLFFSKSMEQFVARDLLVLIFVFAGIGSLTSVLTRIASIDLRAETSNFSVFMSGFSRPVVAMILAFVVYLILSGHMVDIKLGGSNDPRLAYLLISFLCGFSERFAEDIIARVPFASSKPDSGGKQG